MTTQYKVGDRVVALTDGGYINAQVRPGMAGVVVEVDPLGNWVDVEFDERKGLFKPTFHLHEIRPEVETAFKVGDRVEVVDAAAYWFVEVGMRGTVTDVEFENGAVAIKFDKQFGPGHKAAINDTSWVFMPVEIKLVEDEPVEATPKYKIGDRVETLSSGGYSFARAGMIGTVNRMMKQKTGVGVVFDVETYGHHVSDDPGGWSFFWNEIKLVEDEPVEDEPVGYKVGDRVELVENGGFGFAKVGMQGVIILDDRNGAWFDVVLDEHTGEGAESDAAGWTFLPHEIKPAGPSTLDKMRAAHVENARLLKLVINDLQGRVDSGKLWALIQCADRADEASKL